MRSRPLDTFEEWLSSPADETCSDPRFEIRRASLADFERVYAAIDDAFGRRRPKATYDWLWRRSPLGPARCWLLLEKETGEIVSAAGRLPWPLARGTAPIEGALTADSVTIRRRQRQGLRDLRLAARRSDPWRARSGLISWPNEKTRARAVKLGQGDRNLGPLSRWVLPLRTSALLHTHFGVPRPLATLAGAMLDPPLAFARSFWTGGDRVRIEEMGSFDDAFDAVTWEAMAPDRFWSPHDAEFLNWRYRDHPDHEYVCLSAWDGDGPTGYAVVRVGGTRAFLMELVFSRQLASSAHALIRRAATTARAGGCSQLEFVATPSWPNAGVLSRAGFLAAASDVYLHAYGPSREKTPLGSWQLVPGDQDSL